VANRSRIQVEGLAGLQRAFGVFDKTLSRDLRGSLQKAAEPVAAESELLATMQRVGLTWSKMRVGVTRHTVYVAPKARGRKRKATERQFAGLHRQLMPEAMELALERNISEVEDNVDDVLRKASSAWERA
jgi:hypothetical protein